MSLYYLELNSAKNGRLPVLRINHRSYTQNEEKNNFMDIVEFIVDTSGPKIFYRERSINNTINSENGWLQ